MRAKAYLKLEEAMLALDAAADPVADVIRDVMDGLWHRLDEHERAWLDSRGVSTEAEVTIDGVRLTDAQVMALRVAISSRLMDLRENGLGNDDHGRKMTALYIERSSEVEAMLVSGGNRPDRLAKQRKKR